MRRRNPDTRAAKTDPIWRFPYEIVGMYGGSNAHALIKPVGQRAGLAAKALRVRTTELAPYHHHQRELAVLPSEGQVEAAKVKTEEPQPFAVNAGDLNLDAYVGAGGMPAMVREPPPAAAAPAPPAAAPAIAPVDPAAPAAAPAQPVPGGLRRSTRQSHPPDRLTLTGSAADDRPRPAQEPEPPV